MNTYVLIGCIMLVGMVFAGWMHTRDRRRLSLLLKMQADKRQGSICQGSVFMLPQLHLTVHGTQIRVVPMSKSTMSEETGMMTCIDFPIDAREGPTLRIRERRKGLKAALDSVVMNPAHQFELGDPRFDERFQIRSINPGQAKAILEFNGLHKQLLALPAGADLQVQENRCVLSVDGLPENDAELDRLINAGISVLSSIKKRKR